MNIKYLLKQYWFSNAQNDIFKYCSQSDIAKMFINFCHVPLCIPVKGVFQVCCCSHTNRDLLSSHNHLMSLYDLYYWIMFDTLRFIYLYRSGRCSPLSLATAFSWRSINKQLLWYFCILYHNWNQRSVEGKIVISKKTYSQIVLNLRSVEKPFSLSWSLSLLLLYLDLSHCSRMNWDWSWIDLIQKLTSHVFINRKPFFQAHLLYIGFSKFRLSEI